MGRKKKKLTIAIAGFCTGGCGGGPLVFTSLGCRLTAGLDGGGSLLSLGESTWDSRLAMASLNAADMELSLFPGSGEGRTGLLFSGDDLCECCACGSWRGDRGLSGFTWPLRVVPAKVSVGQRLRLAQILPLINPNMRTCHNRQITLRSLKYNTEYVLFFGTQQFPRLTA